MSTDQQTLVITGGRLFDGNGGAVVDDGCVVVTGRDIAYAGSRPGAVWPAGARVIDVGGGTILPGLFDCHVHLCAKTESDGRYERAWRTITPYEDQLFCCLKNANTALLHGFTTLRNMGEQYGEVALKRAIDNGLTGPAARLITTSGHIDMTGGHGDMFVPLPFPRPHWACADGPEECRKAVRHHWRCGTDFIKISTSGGSLSAEKNSMVLNHRLDEIQAITTEAHGLGLRVAAHATAHGGVRNALLGGVDIIEHGTGMDEECIEMMLERGVYLCPTLAIQEAILEWGPRAGIAPAKLEQKRRHHEHYLVMLRRAYQAGVRLIAGTDASQVVPFGNHALELVLMAERIGMSAADTLLAATQTAAAALAVDDITGTLQPGKRADVAVWAGDVLGDIGILHRQKPTLVLKEGSVIVG